MKVFRTHNVIRDTLNLKRIARTSASEISCCDERSMIDVECGRVDTNSRNRRFQWHDARGFVLHAQRIGSVKDASSVRGKAVTWDENKSNARIDLTQNILIPGSMRRVDSMLVRHPISIFPFFKKKILFRETFIAGVSTTALLLLLLLLLQERLLLIAANFRNSCYYVGRVRYCPLAESRTQTAPL